MIKATFQLSEQEIQNHDVDSFISRFKEFILQDDQQGGTFLILEFLQKVIKKEPKFFYNVFTKIQSLAETNDPIILFLIGISYEKKNNDFT